MGPGDKFFPSIKVKDLKQGIGFILVYLWTKGMKSSIVSSRKQEMVIFWSWFFICDIDASGCCKHYWRLVFCSRKAK